MNWPSKSRSLGYAHWPELRSENEMQITQSRSLGYAHWPELFNFTTKDFGESRSLGYAHWPEHNILDIDVSKSLDHWDMRTGRNSAYHARDRILSLDHWDMRTGRNSGVGLCRQRTV